MTEVGPFLLSQLLDAPWNCSTEPGDWVVALGHPDFVAPWRGLDGEGMDCGLLDLWRQGIGDGLPVATDPYQAGDIGVVERQIVIDSVPVCFQSGAIFTGTAWAIRTKRGHVFASRIDVLQAWRP